MHASYKNEIKMYQKDKFVQFAGCMAMLCSQCLLCDISSRMGEGCCFATCCPGALVALRIKLRVQENIQVLNFTDLV